MSKSSPKIVVRRARWDDYEDVMNIDRNVYNGLDYLPTMYHKMVQDPTVDCFLLEMDGKVVSIFLTKLWHCVNYLHTSKGIPKKQLDI